MEKIIILSYFYPPCSLTASNRTNNWAKNLSRFGYYPIVLTRNWSHPIHEQYDLSKSTGKRNEIIKNKKVEVHYLPFIGTLKDKVYYKYKNSKFVFIRKSLSYLEIIFQNYFLFSINKRLFEKASKIIEKNNEIKKVLISASPFNLFFIGFKLKKKHPHINWFADYRDDWSTSEIIIRNSVFKKLIGKIEEKNEKKWLSNATLFFTVSDYYQKKIESFTGKKGNVILNGFDNEINRIKPSETLSHNKFVIAYIGTLYNSQPIEIILDSIKRLIDEFKERIQIIIKFPGLSFDLNQKKRIEFSLSGYEDNYEISKRIPRDEIYNIITSSNLMLMVSHLNQKGIPSSKLYEYIGFKKEILLYPNDNDIIEETLNDTRLGIIANTEGEIYSKLKIKIEFFMDNKSDQKIKFKNIEKYSRLVQTKKLASILDQF